MRANLINSREIAGESWSDSCDALLLGRLGNELALIYRDTLQEPLPAGLKGLIDQLEHSDAENHGGSRGGE